jgi:hypothetical protein
VVATVEAVGVYEWPIAMSIPDSIEALVATGELEQAGRLTDALAAWGRRLDRPWAMATAGRSRALLEESSRLGCRLRRPKRGLRDLGACDRLRGQRHPAAGAALKGDCV